MNGTHPCLHSWLTPFCINNILYFLFDSFTHPKLSFFLDSQVLSLSPHLSPSPPPPLFLMQVYSFSVFMSDTATPHPENNIWQYSQPFSGSYFLSGPSDGSLRPEGINRDGPFGEQHPTVTYSQHLQQL